MKLIRVNSRRRTKRNSFADLLPRINRAKLVASESLPRKPVNIPFSRKKITIISLIVFVIIILLTVIISYIVGIYISFENNRETSIDDFNDLKDSSSEPQLPGSTHKMIYRNRWGGRPPLYERPQRLPVKYVIISHTAGAACFNIPECSKQITQIQSLHVKSGSPDVGYNFLIGGDGNIYVARGWNNHNFHMNLNTIGICFMGNYIYDVLTPGMIEATHQLLKEGVKEGKLEKDFIIVAHNQTYNTESPGQNVYEQIRFWPHFSSEYLTDIDKPN